MACGNSLHGRASQQGTTLLELIIAASILLILSSAALPLVRFTIVRQKEAELRRDLRKMRDAIDRYKDFSDRGLIRVAVGSDRCGTQKFHQPPI